MTAQIRPTRLEVNDRFPMLGLAVHADEPDIDAEVVLATNIGLFQPQNRASRTAANFYSSREHGLLSVPRGDGVFIVPPDVLARFIGNDRLYFGLATGRRLNGGLHVDALPRDGSPYISLQGFTGRTLRRSMASGRQTTSPFLEWTGDAAQPGSEPSNGAASANGSTASRTTNGTNGDGQMPVTAQGLAYDDGFGAMPAVPARATGDTSTAIVPSPVPGDQRQRARRIGGGFPERIGQALDLGLTPASVDPLLNILEPQTTPMPLAQAKGSAAARALGGAAWTINWDGVQMIPQQEALSCWAASAAMIIGWRDNTAPPPQEQIARMASHPLADALAASDREAFATAVGLQSVPPMCYTPEGFRQLLENYGPLWVSKLAEDRFGHIVVATGMYFDGTDYFVRVTDPLDRVVGTPGAPGAYPHPYTHSTGSRYIMTFEDFQREYELRASGTPSYRQILHAGGAFGHIPNRGQTAPPPGYAMAAGDQAADNVSEIHLADAPPPRARAMAGPGAAAAVAIGGILLESVRDNQGDVNWELDQFRGIKHPNDRAPDNPPAFRDGATIRLDDWPVAGGLIDDISAWFKIDWQYNGRSLGNVRITNIGVNDAAGWGLHVRAQIMDDNRTYQPNDCAALRLTFHYRFTRNVGADAIALREVTLYGDGTYETRGEWVQASMLGLDSRRQSNRARN